MQHDADQLDEVRRAYARNIAARAGIDFESQTGREIIAAFKAIPRERFVGPSPWRIVSSEGNFQGVTANQRDLYQDVLVTLSAAKGLNNGQPSLHAYCLNALAPQKGEHAIHVGAGTGYYTAIMATLVGKSGRVDAYEIESDLARQAAINLSEFPQAQTHERSGAQAPLPKCEIIYVSAACAEPLEVWLDVLSEGGRLLFPLEPEGQDGRMLLVTRQSSRIYLARFLCAVQFVACVGAQCPHAAQALHEAFKRGKWEAVKTLHRDNDLDESCWCAGRGWWLSTS